MSTEINDVADAGAGAAGVGVGAADIAVVGASLAGVHAARALRELGHPGRVVVFGAEPHPPYDRPPLSKQVLQGSWEASQTALAAHAHDTGIDWRLGVRVAGLDAATHTLTLPDGTTERFPGGMVLATGATPRRLPAAPAGGVHVVRTLDDSLALAADLARRPQHVVVVGGGFIGAEVAASARSLDLDVTLVELEPILFARTLGPEVGTVLAALHSDRGVRVVTGVGVVAVHGRDRAEAVELSDGRVLPADVVVIGLGVRPETDWLDGSGLRLDDGVVCDATLSAAPGVVGAGDVARWPDRWGDLRRVEHWDNAIRQGRHAAQRLLDEHAGRPGTPFDRVPWMWSDQYDTKVQLVGTTRGHEEIRVVHRDDSRGRLVVLYRRGDQLTAVLGLNAARRLLPYRAQLEAGISWDSALAAAGVGAAA